MNAKLTAQFQAVEQTVQKEVNAKYEEARMVADQRIFDLGFDEACRLYQVGKHAPQ